MKTTSLAFLAAVAATSLAAEEQRRTDAHEHGVSTLELAVEGHHIEMNLHSPGMDIVGFEYGASTDADKDAVEAALRVMLLPENIVTLPSAAECRLAEVLARLHGENQHGDEGEEHAKDEENEHDDGAQHSEFHARYTFACEHPEKLMAIEFPFFQRFEHAQEIEAKYVTEAGAGAAKIGRDAAELRLD